MNTLVGHFSPSIRAGVRFAARAKGDGFAAALVNPDNRIALGWISVLVPATLTN